MSIRVRRLSSGLGAEILGADLTRTLGDDEIAAIRRAWIDHNVLLIRDQDISPAQHIAFSARFGTLEDHAAMYRFRHPEHAEIFIITTRPNADGSPSDTRETGSAWHADMTFMPDPLAFTILRAVELPSIGGDTMWANAAAAYQCLPGPLKLLADNLWSLQTSDFDWEGAYNEDRRAIIRRSSKEDSISARERLVVRTEHPVVLVHPETGEPSLLVGPDVKRFIDLNNTDSGKILEILQSYVTMPENTVRWSWRLGDVAMWDNIMTQHRSVPDHGDDRRVLRRTALRGSVLSGIDGSKSRRLED